ncbi:MAG: hypothetical protein VW270_00915 [Candidatus Poseidoniales archaeon]
MNTINPLVVSVGPSADATPIYPITPTEHGGGVKKVVAVAAAVVIPIAAPAIASSLVASAGISAVTSFAATKVGAAVTSAVVGAALGAVTAKVTGQSVKAGALMGGIGGAIGGYGVASRAPTGVGLTDASRTGIGATFDRAKTSVSNLFGGGEPTASSGTGVSPDAAGESVVGSNVDKTLTSGGGAAGGEALSFTEKLAAVPSKVVDKITNPDTLANLTLQAGGQILATQLIKPGSMPELSPQEAQTLEAYKAELQDLKQKDEAAFNAKMEAAKQYVVQAGYFSPEYFGLQAANKTAIEQEKKLRDFRRTAGLQTGRRGMSAAEERRLALQAGRNVQSSYDAGFQKGMQSQNEALKTGYGMIPSGSPMYANALANQMNYQAGLRRDQDKKRENIAEFFGGLNVASGSDKEKDKQIEELNKRVAGLEGKNNQNALGAPIG